MACPEQLSQGDVDKVAELSDQVATDKIGSATTELTAWMLSRPSYIIISTNSRRLTLEIARHDQPGA